MVCYVAKIREKLIHSIKSTIGKSLSVNMNAAEIYIILNSLDCLLKILRQIESEIYLFETIVL